jgi:hypothetical protein
MLTFHARILYFHIVTLTVFFFGVPCWGQTSPVSTDYFAIRVVDSETGRGVPLVELTTVNQVRYITDSAGYIAFHEPGLMDRDVFFHVKSHGYEYRKDGFGYQGKRLRTTPSGEAILEIERKNVAERLYRMTGQGIYRDSVLLGHETPIANPTLNGLVLGSDSVVNAVYRDRIFWFWGDTNRPGYPLGNFHVPGAVSLLPGQGGLDPAQGVELEYFVNEENGFARPTANMPGEGPTWINGLTVLTNEQGEERMFATYVKIRKHLDVYERGLVEFNSDANRFEQAIVFPLDAPLYPTGHPFTHIDDGVEYVYFADPLPMVRVCATVEDFMNLDAYETFTCFAPFDSAEASNDVAQPRLDRDEEGHLRYAWKRNAPPLTQAHERRLVRQGEIAPDEARFQVEEPGTERLLHLHRGSVYWNEYRNRWVMIACQSGGDSQLGEIWYLESDSPEGPWRSPQNILSHDAYSFYNPKQHPMFDDEGGRIIYFEGTYTTTFSGGSERTPYYDYNQIMYRLDLDHPRLELP